MNKAGIRASVAALFGTVGLLALTGCDGGSARSHDQSASVGARPAASLGGTPASADQGAGGAPDRADPRREPVRLVHGKPMWAANRRHGADENAEYQFNRDGADFGAKSVDDFVDKVHAFVDHPPAGAYSLVRSNGKLLYDPKANVFAVVTKDGAPRTMFKPRDGAAYWDEQKAREAERANGGSSGNGGRYRARNADDQG